MYRLGRAAGEIHRFVARRIANVADAEDIAQQTLLVALVKFSTFRGENVTAWVFTSARNLIIDYYRARSRFEFVDVGQEALTETESALKTPGNGVQAQHESRRQLADWLRRVTRGLELPQQVAVILADLFGYRDKDSAAMLRMSVPSFKLLLHRARARLRAIAGETGADLRRASAARKKANGGRRKMTRRDRRASSGRPNQRIGVRRGVSARELLALRRKLLDGLEV